MDQIIAFHSDNCSYTGSVKSTTEGNQGKMYNIKLKMETLDEQIIEKQSLMITKLKNDNSVLKGILSKAYSQIKQLSRQIQQSPKQCNYQQENGQSTLYLQIENIQLKRQLQQIHSQFKRYRESAVPQRLQLSEQMDKLTKQVEYYTSAFQTLQQENTRKLNQINEKESQIWQLRSSIAELTQSNYLQHNLIDKMRVEQASKQSRQDFRYLCYDRKRRQSDDILIQDEQFVTSHCPDTQKFDAGIQTQMYQSLQFNNMISERNANSNRKNHHISPEGDKDLKISEYARQLTKKQRECVYQQKALDLLKKQKKELEEKVKQKQRDNKRQHKKYRKLARKYEAVHKNEQQQSFSDDAENESVTDIRRSSRISNLHSYIQETVFHSVQMQTEQTRIQNPKFAYDSAIPDKNKKISEPSITQMSKKQKRRKNRTIQNDHQDGREKLKSLNQELQRKDHVVGKLENQATQLRNLLSGTKSKLRKKQNECKKLARDLRGIKSGYSQREESVLVCQGAAQQIIYHEVQIQTQEMRLHEGRNSAKKANKPLRQARPSQKAQTRQLPKQNSLIIQNQPLSPLTSSISQHKLDRYPNKQQLRILIPNESLRQGMVHISPRSQSHNHRQLGQQVCIQRLQRQNQRIKQQSVSLRQQLQQLKRNWAEGLKNIQREYCSESGSDFHSQREIYGGVSDQDVPPKRFRERFEDENDCHIRAESKAQLIEAEVQTVQMGQALDQERSKGQRQQQSRIVQDVSQKGRVRQDISQESRSQIKSNEFDCDVINNLEVQSQRGGGEGLKQLRHASVYQQKKSRKRINLNAQEQKLREENRQNNELRKELKQLQKVLKQLRKSQEIFKLRLKAKTNNLKKVVKQKNTLKAQTRSNASLSLRKDYNIQSIIKRSQMADSQQIEAICYQVEVQTVGHQAQISQIENRLDLCLRNENVFAIQIHCHQVQVQTQEYGRMTNQNTQNNNFLQAQRGQGGTRNSINRSNKSIVSEDRSGHEQNPSNQNITGEYKQSRHHRVPRGQLNAKVKQLTEKLQAMQKQLQQQMAKVQKLTYKKYEVQNEEERQLSQSHKNQLIDMAQQTDQTICLTVQPIEMKAQREQMQQSQSTVKVEQSNKKQVQRTSIDRKINQIYHFKQKKLLSEPQNKIRPRVSFDNLKDIEYIFDSSQSITERLERLCKLKEQQQQGGGNVNCMIRSTESKLLIEAEDDEKQQTDSQIYQEQEVATQSKKDGVQDSQYQSGQRSQYGTQSIVNIFVSKDRWTQGALSRQVTITESNFVNQKKKEQHQERQYTQSVQIHNSQQQRSAKPAQSQTINQQALMYKQELLLTLQVNFQLQNQVHYLSTKIKGLTRELESFKKYLNEKDIILHQKMAQLVENMGLVQKMKVQREQMVKSLEHYISSSKENSPINRQLYIIQNKPQPNQNTYQVLEEEIKATKQANNLSNNQHSQPTKEERVSNNPHSQPTNQEIISNQNQAPQQVTQKAPQQQRVSYNGTLGVQSSSQSSFYVINQNPAQEPPLSLKCSISEIQKQVLLPRLQYCGLGSSVGQQIVKYGNLTGSQIFTEKQNKQSGFFKKNVQRPVQEQASAILSSSLQNCSNNGKISSVQLSNSKKQQLLFNQMLIHQTHSQILKCKQCLIYSIEIKRLEDHINTLQLDIDELDVEMRKKQQMDNLSFNLKPSEQEEHLAFIEQIDIVPRGIVTSSDINIVVPQVQTIEILIKQSEKEQILASSLSGIKKQQAAEQELTFQAIDKIFTLQNLSNLPFIYYDYNQGYHHPEEESRGSLRQSQISSRKSYTRGSIKMGLKHEELVILEQAKKQLEGLYQPAIIVRSSMNHQTPQQAELTDERIQRSVNDQNQPPKQQHIPTSPYESQTQNKPTPSLASPKFPILFISNQQQVNYQPTNKKYERDIFNPIFINYPKNITAKSALIGTELNQLLLENYLSNIDSKLSIQKLISDQLKTLTLKVFWWISMMQKNKAQNISKVSPKRQEDQIQQDQFLLDEEQPDKPQRNAYDSSSLVTHSNQIIHQIVQSLGTGFLYLQQSDITTLLYQDFESILNEIQNKHLQHSKLQVSL